MASLPPLDVFMAIDPNSYLDPVPGWKSEASALAADFAEYKAGVDRPGGTDWFGRTAGAAQDKAGDDSNAMVSFHDTIESLVSEVTATVTYSVLPPLNNGRTIVNNAQRTEGVTVNQDYTMTYTPPDGMSAEQADKNKQTVAAAARELKDSADKWFAGTQSVADQIHAAESKISSTMNLAAVGASGRLAVRAAAANGAVADIPSDLRNLKGLDAAATTPAGAMPGGLTDTLGRLPQDQPGAPPKDKLGKPAIPIPEQELAKKDKEFGTQTGKGVDKSPEGRNTTPTGTSMGGKFGDQTKIGDGKGPTVWKGETGEHGDQVNHWEREGRFLGGDYKLESNQLSYEAGASSEVKKDSLGAKEHAGAYIIDNKGNIHWNLGENGDQGKIEAKIFGNAGVDEYGGAGVVAEKGTQLQGGAMLGIHTGQELNYNGHGLEVKGGVEEWAGGGAGAHLTFAETQDHKWKIGGSWGIALGIGAKPGFEVTVDPKEFGTELGKLWGWVKN
ncbi:hypothetical protein [Mycobacteroides chelonae]|uniref:hypothetical protein n=1 Tax=Mycobacteroides chelonae TaxID=1774 RepID=UPI000B1598E5|nr:hypothetical protein [Mycobacteroides chelonae]